MSDKEIALLMGAAYLTGVLFGFVAAIVCIAGSKKDKIRAGEKP